MTRQDICTHPSVSSSKFLLGLELRSVQRSRAAGWGRRETLLTWEVGAEEEGLQEPLAPELPLCTCCGSFLLQCKTGPLIHLGVNVPAVGCPGSLVLAATQGGCAAPPCTSLLSASGRLEPRPWEPFATLRCGSSWLRPLTWKASRAHQFSLRSLTFSLVRPACHNHVSFKCNEPLPLALALNVLANCGHNQLVLLPPAQPCVEIASEGHFLLLGFFTSEVAYVALFM